MVSNDDIDKVVVAINNYESQDFNTSIKLYNSTTRLKILFPGFCAINVDDSILSGLADMFPSLTLYNRNEVILFAIEVKSGKSIEECIKKWKTILLHNITTFIMVPPEELENTKQLALTNEIKCRFATFKIEERDKRSYPRGFAPPKQPYIIDEDYFVKVKYLF